MKKQLRHPTHLHIVRSNHYAASPWNGGSEGDIPYGIAFLEKGIFVIFDIYGRTDLISLSTISTDLYGLHHQLVLVHIQLHLLQLQKYKCGK